MNEKEQSDEKSETNSRWNVDHKQKLSRKKTDEWKIVWKVANTWQSVQRPTNLAKLNLKGVRREIFFWIKLRINVSSFQYWRFISCIRFGKPVNCMQRSQQVSYCKYCGFPDRKTRRFFCFMDSFLLRLASLQLELSVFLLNTFPRKKKMRKNCFEYQINYLTVS